MKKLLIWLDHIHWLLLFLAAPFMLFPTPKRSLAMLVVPGLWLLRCFVVHTYPLLENHSLCLPVTPFNGTLLLMITMIVVSLWATYDIAFSLEKISGVVLGLGVFYTVVREGKRPLGWWLSFLIFLGFGLMVAAAGFFGMKWQVRFRFLETIIQRLPRLLRGLPGAEVGLQHNAVGGTLIWVIPSFLVLSFYVLKPLDASALCFVNESWCRRLLWLLRLAVWLSTFFMTSVLILTQSRGSYLALGISGILMLFLVLPFRWRWALAIGVTLAIITLGLILYRIGWGQFVDIVGLSDQSGLSLNTLKGRVEIWSRAIYGLQDFPFTGMGMNTFREVVHVLYPLFLISPDVDIAHAHNEYLQAGLDLGIPGLIAFLSIHIVAFWMLFDVWKANCNSRFLHPNSCTTPPTLQRSIVIGLGGGLTAHMLFGITDAITLGAKPGILWWILLGLIAGLHKQIAAFRKSAEVD
jgi:putative inorganic carbon (HCO3(-)) transporter